MLKYIRACSDAQKPLCVPLKGIIFDMDGTLTKPSIDFPKMRKQLGVPAGQDILGYIGGIQVVEEKERLEKIVCDIEKEARANLQLQDDCLETLLHIQQKSIPCAIITRNNREGVVDFLQLLAKLLKQTDLNLTFEPIITREDGEEFCKPKPGGVAHICKTWDINPENVLMVGDHLHDIAAGRDAGTATCLLLCKEPSNKKFSKDASFNISSLKELQLLEFIIKE